MAKGCPGSRTRMPCFRSSRAERLPRKRQTEVLSLGAIATSQLRASDRNATCVCLPVTNRYKYRFTRRLGWASTLDATGVARNRGDKPILRPIEFAEQPPPPQTSWPPSNGVTGPSRKAFYPQFLPHAGTNANVVQRTGQTYSPHAIRDQCACTITHPGPRTSNGSSILTRPSVGRS